MADSPRLLVSVRDRDEAELALRAGVDVVDVKDPDRGSLGRADDRALAEIAEVVGRRVPLSAALGELRDFDRQCVPELPSNCQFVKLGLAGLRDDSSWIDRWREVRTRVDRRVQWIAVAYVDEAALSPPIPSVVAAAIETGCQGVLLDTWSKSGGTLLDCLTVGNLSQIASDIHAAGLWLAVAGGLRLTDVPVLRDVRPDVFAVRSAVCRDGDRRQPLDPARLAAWRRCLESPVALGARVR